MKIEANTNSYLNESQEIRLIYCRNLLSAFEVWMIYIIGVPKLVYQNQKSLLVKLSGLLITKLEKQFNLSCFSIEKMDIAVEKTSHMYIAH